MKKILVAIVVALTGRLLMADALRDSLNNQTLVFTTGGDSNWTSQSGTTHDGAAALFSGSLSSGQSSWVEATVTGPCILSYYAKTSSYYDGLYCYVDDSQKGSLSYTWDSSWRIFNVLVTDGEHTVKWQYNKIDSYYAYGAYLDEVSISTIGSYLGCELVMSVDDGWTISSSSSSSNLSYNTQLESDSLKCISTSVSGVGTLRFKSSGDLWYEGYEFGLEVDGSTKWAKTCNNGSYAYWNESWFSIPVLTKGDHDIVWYVSNDSENTIYGNVRISNVEWIPAPANVVVSFDGEGGTINGEVTFFKSFATGECYGSLPMPTCNGLTFDGWFTTEGVKVNATDYVNPIATNLVARYVAKLPGTTGAIESSGEIYSDGEGLVLPMPDYDFSEYDGDDPEYIEVTCEGEAIVTFEVELDFEREDCEEYAYADAQVRFSVDGSLEDNGWCYGSIRENGYTNGPGSRYVRRRLAAGTHRLRWEVPNYYSYNSTQARLRIKNFTVEPVEDRVVEGEAIVSFDWIGHATINGYGGMSAQREFTIDGAQANVGNTAWCFGTGMTNYFEHIRVHVPAGTHQLRMTIPSANGQNVTPDFRIENYKVEKSQSRQVEGPAIVSFDWVADVTTTNLTANRYYYANGRYVTGDYWSYSAKREFTVDGSAMPYGNDDWSFSQTLGTNRFEHIRVHIPEGSHELRMNVLQAYGSNASADFRIEKLKVEKVTPIVVEGESIVSFDWTATAVPKGGDWSVVATREFTIDGEHCSYDGAGRNWSFSNSVTNDRIHIRTHLTPGSHKLLCLATSAYGVNASADFAVKNLKVEPVEMATDLSDWVRLMAEFNVWKPDNLVSLRDDVYGTRIAANSEDYEARILRAAIKVAMLVENDEARRFLQECGFTVADYTLKLTGEFYGIDHLSPANDIVDRLSPEALTVIDDALTDLNAIPENWNGDLELKPSKYEFLTESVYVDLAEITLFKSTLEAARAAVLLVQGYDFTMDYVSVSNALRNAELASDVMAIAPKAGAIRDSKKLLESKKWFKKALQHVRRADQIILWRSNPLPHFFEYDVVDADNIARARLYLEQLIGSLDHPETIDLPYFVDKFGYKGETLPMGMFRQLYLGALFAGRVTRDLVPEAEINPFSLHMDSVEDTALGGLLPDFGFDEFASLFPCSQYWSLALYNDVRPQSRLLKNQTLTVADVSLCDGTLEYVANLQYLEAGVARCEVNGLVVDTVEASQVESVETRTLVIPFDAEYRLVYDSGDMCMSARREIFEIISIPECAPVGDGVYSQVVNGVTWTFTVADDEATVVGTGSSLSGDVVIPEKLGGRVVTAIGAEAFRGSKISSVTIPATVTDIGELAFYKSTASSILFLGAEPTVDDLAFYGVKATAVFAGGTTLTGLSAGTWQGMSVQYFDDVTNEDLRVCASLPDGYEFNGMATLSLSVSGDATIYFTMNGAEPTTNALVYSSPISVSITTRIKYFAVDNQNGDTGPVGTLLLKLVTPDSALLSNSEYSKTVNGIGWSYQEYTNGVRLTGNSGTAAGDKVTGAIVIPDAINWQPVTVIGAGLFSSCESVTSIKIPSTVTDIERDAFRGCTRLESITLPDGLMSIADGAFERCTSLTNIVIPATVTNIGYFVFRDCLRLADVVLKGDPPRQDLGVYMGVPAFTVISGRMGSATAIVYAGITNKTDEITVPESWLDEIAAVHDKPAGADSYQAAFKDKYGDDLKDALTKPTGKYDLKGNPLYVWQDYVAGTDPLDEEDKFTATITMENGVPVVRWSPELSDAAAATRKYTVYGATALNGKWDDVTDKTDQKRHDLGYQFFSVTVEMK